MVDDLRDGDRGEIKDADNSRSGIIGIFDPAVKIDRLGYKATNGALKKFSHGLHEDANEKIPFS